MIRLVKSLILFLLLFPAVGLAQPTVTATRDIPDYIRVTWTPIASAIRYEVYRAGPGTPYTLACTNFPIVRITPDYSGEVIFDQYAASDPQGFPNPGQNAYFAVRAVFVDGSRSPCSLWARGSFAPPEITQDVQGARAFIGTPVTFSVSAVGPHLQYRWQRKLFGQSQGSDIPGAPNGPSFTFVTAQGDAAYVYGVVISNAPNSTVTSSFRNLTLDGAPHITSHPQSQSRVVGQQVTFSVGASGYQLQYQWEVFRNNRWESIPGANQDLYSFVTQYFDDGLAFRCVVSNGAGVVVSNAAQLVVQNLPRIDAQPQSQTRFTTQVAHFSITASGQLLSYQWEWQSPNGWQSIPGQTGSELSFTVPHVSYHGYTVRCRVANAAGSVASQSAVLTVIGPPSIIQHPVNVTVQVGQPAHFTSYAEGVELSGVHWQYRSPGAEWITFGAGMPSAFTDTLRFEAAWIELDQTELRMCAVNPGGETCSLSARLSVQPPPSSSSSSSSEASSSSSPASSSEGSSSSSGNSSEGSSENSSESSSVPGSNSSGSASSAPVSSTSSSGSSSVPGGSSASSSSQGSSDAFLEQGCITADLAEVKVAITRQVVTVIRSGVRTSNRVASRASRDVQQSVVRQVRQLKRFGERATARVEQMVAEIPSVALLCPETLVCRSSDRMALKSALLAEEKALRKRGLAVPGRIARQLGLSGDAIIKRALTSNKRAIKKAGGAVAQNVSQIPDVVSECSR